MRSGKRKAVTVLICGIGLISFIGHLIHLSSEQQIEATLTGVLAPMLVSLALFGAGVWIYRSGLPDEYFPRIVLWMIFGAFGLVILGSLLIVYQNTHNIVLDDQEFIIVNWFVTGALGGVTVGVYDARLRVVNQQLERERDALAFQERELERENERLNDFAGIVSHDLRNPLNVAEGRLQLYRDSGAKEHLEAVTDALSRMETLIDDFLTMAREGEAVSEEELTAVNLAEIVDACWSEIEFRDADLRIEADATFFADESRLKTVFENLFRNAIEHGGESVTVTIGPIASGGGFYVEDTGPGLPPDVNVFEAGFTTNQDGTGFGLAIVQDIVTAHGWAIEAKEGSEGGARFEISGVSTIR